MSFEQQEGSVEISDADINVLDDALEQLKLDILRISGILGKEKNLGAVDTLLDNFDNILPQDLAHKLFIIFEGKAGLKDILVRMRENLGSSSDYHETTVNLLKCELNKQLGKLEGFVIGVSIE